MSGRTGPKSIGEATGTVTEEWKDSNVRYKGTTPRYKVETVKEAIVASRGVLSQAAKILGCSRTCVANYVSRHPTLAKAFEEQRNTLVDLAESQLWTKLEIGEWPAIKFVLMTQGKERGYTPRQEITGAEGGKVIVEFTGNIDSDKL